MALAKRPIDADLRGPKRNSDPARGALKITKSDTNDIWGNVYNRVTSPACAALNVGTAGTATFIDADNNLCTDYPLKEGTNAIGIKQLKAGGTADDIWLLYH